MMYGGSLSSRHIGARDDVSVEFRELGLDQRLPTSTRGSVATAASRLAELGVKPGRYSGVEQVFAGAATMADGVDGQLAGNDDQVVDLFRRGAVAAGVSGQRRAQRVQPVGVDRLVHVRGG